MLTKPTQKQTHGSFCHTILLHCSTHFCSVYMKSQLTSMSSNRRPGSMETVRSYLAAFLPGMEDRKESLMAHAPSTASSNPGRRHTELLLIQPLLNNVSASIETQKTYKGCVVENACGSKRVTTENRKTRTVMSWCVQVHLFSHMWQDRSDGSRHAIQNFL